MFALAGAGVPSVLLVAAFAGFVWLVRRRAPANAQLLFNLALGASYAIALLCFASAVDQFLSPLVLLAVMAVLPPRLGRAIVAQHPKCCTPLIHCSAATGLLLCIVSLVVVFATFNFVLFMVIAPLGIGLYWMGECVHTDGRPARLR